jgi:putative methyltransferase (TIGR04325 family)
MKSWPESRQAGMLKGICEDPDEQEFWIKLFDSICESPGGIDTWDHQWNYAIQNKLKKEDKGSLGYRYMEYAPEGWKTQLANDQNKGWSVDSVVEAESVKWEAFNNNLKGAGPLGFSHEHTDMSVVRNPSFHNVHISFAYVLTLAARKKDNVSVLDYGGSLGHYYQIGKAVLPDVAIDFHVKEVSMVAEAGRQINPEVHWYDDESCLDRSYDLVMITGAIPYMEDWIDAMHRISKAVGNYLFIARLPVIEKCPSFVSVQHIYNSQMLHQQFNQGEVLEVVKDTGLTLVREFVIGDRPYIKGAPEQCEVRGWLFRK